MVIIFLHSFAIFSRKILFWSKKMKKILFATFLSYSLFAQTLPLPSSDDLKYKAAQFIDEGTMEAVKKANENNELGNKSGFVLGVSLGLKDFNVQQIISGFQELSSRTPSLNGGIVLGYQYFFNKYVGLRLTGMVNVGTQARIKATKILSTNDAKPNPIQDLYQAYLPIEAGADLVVLATLYEKDKHAFGISAGFGYEADWYVVQKASSQSTVEALTNLLQSPNSLVNQGIYPEFGIFYFYGSHQFEIAYRFAEFSFMGDQGKDWSFDLGGNKTANAKTTFLKTSSFILSYLYRF